MRAAVAAPACAQCPPSRLARRRAARALSKLPSEMLLDAGSRTLKDFGATAEVRARPRAQLASQIQICIRECSASRVSAPQERYFAEKAAGLKVLFFEQYKLVLRDLSSSAAAAAGALGAAAAAAASGAGGASAVRPAEVTASSEPMAYAADGARACARGGRMGAVCDASAGFVTGTEWPLRDLVTKTLIFLRDNVLEAISREASGE